MQKVLFVCVHNSGRSQMAEAFFNKMAKGKAVALSAGTQPAEIINPKVVEVMKEEGIDISNKKPKLLTLDLINKVDKVITMGCGLDKLCPATAIPTEDWALEDPEGKILEEVRKIKDIIKVKVEGLLKEIDLGK